MEEVTTRVILVRHGEMDLETGGLSHLGRKGVEELGKKLLQQGVHAERLFSSPLLRAIETAYLLQSILGGEVEILSALGEQFDEKALLQKVASSQTTFFVGHEPSLPAFARRLTGTAILATGMGQATAALMTFEKEPALGTAQLLAYLS
ncbi:MAG: histidine phosphatase family protein [Verrucomicrobia bacterium]|nr:histidine phosphatase family protein [Verrucomicrobiota bacterium]